MKIPTSIMIHHTAVSYRLNPDQFKANNAYHKRKWNFRSKLGFYLGYNYEISRDGRITKAREPGEVTAACYQNNMNDGNCIHIALDGNFELEQPYPNEIYALRDHLRYLSDRFKIHSTSVYFHKQYSATKCPGKNMDLNFVRSLLEDRAEN